MLVTQSTNSFYPKNGQLIIKAKLILSKIYKQELFDYIRYYLYRNKE